MTCYGIRFHPVEGKLARNVIITVSLIWEFPVAMRKLSYYYGTGEQREFSICWST